MIDLIFKILYLKLVLILLSFSCNNNKNIDKKLNNLDENKNNNHIYTKDNQYKNNFFSIKFPGKPKEELNKLLLKNQILYSRRYIFEVTDTILYSVEFTDYNDSLIKKVGTIRLLHSIKDFIIDYFNLKHKLNEKFSFHPYPTLLFNAHNEHLYAYYKIILNNNRLWQISIISRQAVAENLIKEFMNSFSINN